MLIPYSQCLRGFVYTLFSLMVTVLATEAFADCKADKSALATAQRQDTAAITKAKAADDKFNTADQAMLTAKAAAENYDKTSQFDSNLCIAAQEGCRMGSKQDCKSQKGVCATATKVYKKDTALKSKYTKVNSAAIAAQTADNNAKTAQKDADAALSAAQAQMQKDGCK